MLLRRPEPGELELGYPRVEKIRPVVELLNHRLPLLKGQIGVRLNRLEDLALLSRNNLLNQKVELLKFVSHEVRKKWRPLVHHQTRMLSFDMPVQNAAAYAYTREHLHHLFIRRALQLPDTLRVLNYLAHVLNLVALLLRRLA